MDSESNEPGERMRRRLANLRPGAGTAASVRAAAVRRERLRPRVARALAENGYSLWAVARKLRLHFRTVKLLAPHPRPKPDYSTRRLAGFSTAELKRLHETNHFNTRPLLELLGVSRITLGREFRRRGLQLRSGVRHGCPSKESLVELYGRRHYTIAQVGRTFGASPETARAWLEAKGIVRRHERGSGGRFE